jgi:hypothetical protein
MANGTRAKPRVLAAVAWAVATFGGDRSRQIDTFVQAKAYNPVILTARNPAVLVLKYLLYLYLGRWCGVVRALL